MEDCACDDADTCPDISHDADLDGREVYGPVLPPFESYAYGGGEILYFDERNTGDSYCAECATHERDFGGAYRRHPFEPIAYIHEEGAPVNCTNCDKRVLSSYGDPECIVCAGEVSGLTNTNELWECPECSDGKETLSWMRDNVTRYLESEGM